VIFEDNSPKGVMLWVSKMYSYLCLIYKKLNANVQTLLFKMNLKQMLETKNIHRKKINEIFDLRIPSFIWGIFGILGLFVNIYFKNENFIYVYLSLFAFYGITNIFFDIMVVTFEYNHLDMPKYNEIDYLYFIILNNKKYAYINCKFDKNFNLITVDKYNARDVYSQIHKCISIDTSFYIGSNKIIQYVLYCIYILGITYKNFTLLTENDFDESYNPPIIQIFTPPYPPL
jgi:hypothetical protein